MHVRKRVGGPRDRTKNGFLLVSTLLRAVRLLRRDLQRKRERESRRTPRHLNIHAVPRCTRAMSK